MKTPEEWSGLILGLHYKSSAIPIIEQIQRDARKGTIDRKLAQETLEEAMETMVPIQDVVRLLEDSDRIAEQLAAACQAFRAKHTNLFPK